MTYPPCHRVTIGWHSLHFQQPLAAPGPLRLVDLHSTGYQSERQSCELTDLAWWDGQDHVGCIPKNIIQNILPKHSRFYEQFISNTLKGIQKIRGDFPWQDRLPKNRDHELANLVLKSRLGNPPRNMVIMIFQWPASSHIENRIKSSTL